MKWVTFEDFKADPNKKCPQCGSTEDLDIDFEQPRLNLSPWFSHTLSWAGPI